jgi:LysR family carnitine catabolism transcriptional activator
MTDAAFVNCEVFVEPAYELEQIPSVAALVEAGVGISALPELTLSMIRGANIVARPLSQPVIQRRIGSVTLGRRAMPAHVAAFTEELRRTFRTVKLSR